MTFGAWDAPCNLVVLVMVSFKGFCAFFFEWLFCFNCFASNGFCNNLRYEMVTGELLYYDPPDEYTEVPAVNWPAFKEALQTAFYELMSTPTRRIALETVGAWLSILVVFSFLFCLALKINSSIWFKPSLITGELSELCGDWAEPKTGASIERAVRKGNKDPKLITAKNRERAKRRKRAKEKNVPARQRLRLAAATLKLSSSRTTICKTTTRKMMTMMTAMMRNQRK